MARYNTGNPIDSAAMKDLSDNAQNLDEAVNSSADTFQDRMGKSRLTWAGMESGFGAGQVSREQRFQSAQSSREAVFSDFLQASGYQDLGEYAPGIEITAHNQYVMFDGQPYLLNPSISVPYTTSGEWTGDDFKLIGDESLRQDLANPDKGAAMAGRGVVAVNSVADLLALSEEQRKAGLRYLVTSYHAGWWESVPYLGPRGGGEFVYDPERVGENNLGTVINGFVRVVEGNTLTPYMFGGVSGRAEDDSAALSALVQAIPDGWTMELDGVEWRHTSDMEIRKSIKISGSGGRIISDSSARMTMGGTRQELGAIFASPASAGDTNIQLTDTSEISAGTFLLLRNSDDFSFSDARSAYRDGQIVKVKDVSGEDVTLVGKLETEFGTGANYIVEIVHAIQLNLDWVHFEKIGAFGSVVTENLAECSFNRATFTNTKGHSAARLIYFYDVQTRGCSFINSDSRGPEDTFGYGAWWEACFKVRDEGSTFYSRRHASCVSGQLCTRGITFRDSTFTTFGDVNNTHAADFHGAVDNGWYYNCTFYGGVVLAGSNVGVRGGTAYSNAAQGPLYMRELRGGIVEFSNIKAYIYNDSRATGVHSSLEHYFLKYPTTHIFHNIDIEYASGFSPADLLSVPLRTPNDVPVEISIQGITTNRGGSTALLHLDETADFGGYIRKLTIRDINFLENKPVRWVSRLSAVVRAETTVSLPTQRVNRPGIRVPAGDVLRTQVSAPIRYPFGNITVRPRVESTASLLTTFGHLSGDANGYYYFGHLRVNDVAGELESNTTMNATVDFVCEEVSPIFPEMEEE